MSLVPATAWSNRPTRRLEATRAAHEGDLETLLELLSFFSPQEPQGAGGIAGDPAHLRHRHPQVLVRSGRLKGFSPAGLEESSEPEDLRDRVAVRLLGQAGLRLAETVAVRVGDLQLEHRLLFVAHGKGDKTRWVPLTAATVKSIREWLRARAALSLTSDHLLVNLGGRRAHGRGMTPRTLWAHLDRRYKGLQLELKGAHILRHRAGTRFQRDGKDIYKTARLLGHANIQTSTLYAEAQVGELAEVMEMQGE